MKFTVHELPKAQIDKRHIVAWLFQRSSQGAAAWLTAYDGMLERLRLAADSLPLAAENDHFEFDIRQVLFKTRRGRIYRAIFFVEGLDVYVLRVRGPGQAPVYPDDLRP